MRPRLDRRGFLAGSASLAAMATPGARATGRAAFPIGLCRGPGDWAPLAAAGAEFVEVRVSGDLVPDRSEADFAPRLEALKKAALPARAANNFLPGRLRCTGPEADHAAVRAYSKVAFGRARRVGVEVVTFGSSAARSLPEGFTAEEARPQFVSLLRSLGELAAAAEVQLALEPLRKKETNYLNSLAEAEDIVRRVEHPNVGLTADLYHMALAGEGPEALRTAGKLVRHVHVAERRARTAPGVDGDDFRGSLSALAQVGYGGLISIESGWGDLSVELPRAVSTLREQMGSD